MFFTWSSLEAENLNIPAFNCSGAIIMEQFLKYAVMFVSMYECSFHVLPLHKLSTDKAFCECTICPYIAQDYRYIW